MDHPLLFLHFFWVVHYYFIIKQSEENKGKIIKRKIIDFGYDSPKGLDRKKVDSEGNLIGSRRQNRTTRKNETHTTNMELCKETWAGQPQRVQCLESGCTKTIQNIVDNIVQHHNTKNHTPVDETVSREDGLQQLGYSSFLKKNKVIVGL